MPSPPPSNLLPGDHLNFSFSPASPPPELPPPHPLFDPNHTSNISPSLLYSLDSPHDHTHFDEDEEEDEEMVVIEEEEETEFEVSRKRKLVVEEEDRQRRGPPEADTPGGDCKSLCVRHQRMANGGTNLMLQKSIETLPPNDQTCVNTIWSLFSSSPGRRRLLILRGLLTIACPSQLTFLQDTLTLEMRLDPLAVLPREICLKIFGYLDAISLGRAAQVSNDWKLVADDDVLWRTMCEQHIEKKCEKCGWGLPLLTGERRRKARNGKGKEKERVVGVGAGGEEKEEERLVTEGGSSIGTELWQPTPSSASSSMTIDTATATSTHSGRPTKRAKTESPAPSRSSTPVPGSPRSSSRASIVPITRPWKLVYCERLAIERNWRKGTFSTLILSGHTDSITCLQVAEDLPHPNFPVLMTGSWDRTVRIWNLESGKEVGIIRGHTRGIRALQFDAAKLITGSMDATLKIWNWRTGECLRTLRGHGDAVICLTYDSQLLVSGSADSTIRVWDFGTGDVGVLRGHSEWVNSVQLWDSRTGFSKTSHDGDLGKPVQDAIGAKETSKGKFLFSASDDMTIRCWDLWSRTCVRVLSGHVAQVQSLRVITLEVGKGMGPTPATTSTTKEGGESKIRHQVVEGNAYDDFFHQQGGPLASTSTSFVPGSQVPVGGATREAYQAAAAIPPPDSSTLLPLHLARDDKKPCIVSASLDNTVKVWDVEKGVCERTLFGHIEGVWDVDVDKLRIVSGSHDRTLKIWDKESGRNLHTLVGHTSAVTAVALTDSFVVSGGDDGNARVWKFT